MTKVILLLILCLVNFNLSGQIEEGVNKALLTLDFKKFKLHTTTMESKRWEYIRDLTPHYKEATFIFSYEVPAKGGGHYDNYFNVKMIIFKKEIIYYRLSEKLYFEINGKYVPRFKTLHKYKNDSLCTALNSEFKQIYSANLDESELFNDTIRYSYFEGSKYLPERIQIDSFVKINKRDSLFKWLQSSNLEKQMYAVDGYYHLKKKGLKLTDTELKLIKAVMKRKGSIRVLSGCSVRINMKYFKKMFKF